MSNPLRSLSEHSWILGIYESRRCICKLSFIRWGHLSHGLKINISGKYFEVHYPLIYDENNPNFETIDYDAVKKFALTQTKDVAMRL